MKPSMHYPKRKNLDRSRRPLKIFMVIIVILAALAGHHVADSTLRLGQTQNLQASTPAPKPKPSPKPESEPTPEPAETNQQLNLFLPHSQPPWLHSTQAAILPNDSNALTQARYILQKLYELSSRDSFPTQLNLLAVYRVQDTLVVDFSRETLELFHQEEMRNIQLIFSIANSLLSNFRMERLRLLFGGRPSPDNATGLNLQEPLVLNPRINLENAP